MRFLRILVSLCFAIMPGFAWAAGSSSIYFFGDSLTDEGRAGQTASVMWPSVFRTDTNINSGTNYAIGGSYTSNQPDPVFGDRSFLGQVNSFVSTSAPLGATPAAGIWIGTNNIWIQSGQGVAPATIAANASTDVKTGITTLKTAGITNFYLLGVYDLSLTNAFYLAGTSTLATRAAAASASQQYNAHLAALSVPGTAIQFVNIANFINQLMTHPQQYGFTQILPLLPGQTCAGTCQQTSIFTDTIHLTSATQTLIGNYVASGNYAYNNTNFTYGAIAANAGSAMESAPLPAQFARGAAQNFTNDVFTRLDTSRDPPVPDVFAANFMGRSVGLAPARPQPWTVFADGNFSGGTLAHIGVLAGTNAELDYGAAGATLGVQYRLLPELRTGAVFNYGHVNADLTSTIGSKTTLDAYQGALYASLSLPNFFADGILTGSADSFGQTRTGVFGQVSASPKGSTFSASERAGYLSRVGPFRAGPVLGIAYTHTSVDAYTETGAALNVLTYQTQASHDVEGSAGVEIRLADPRRWNMDPFVAVTYEHEFTRTGQPILAAFAYLPTQGLPTSVYAGEDAVKFAGGTSVTLARNWTGTLSAFGLVGLKDYASYGVNGGVAYRF